MLGIGECNTINPLPDKTIKIMINFNSVSKTNQLTFEEKKLFKYLFQTQTLD